MERQESAKNYNVGTLYLFGYSNFIIGEIAERLLVLFQGHFSLIPNIIDTDYSTDL